MIGSVYDLVEKEAIYQGADWFKEFQIVDPTTKLRTDAEKQLNTTEGEEE